MTASGSRWGLAQNLTRAQFVTGPPPEHATVLRTDRLYDPNKLRRAYLKGKDPESAVIWRLDRPLGLAGAEDELIRRRTYQPLGSYWAIGPARTLAALAQADLGSTERGDTCLGGLSPRGGGDGGVWS